MKTKLRIFLTIAALFLISASAPDASAQIKVGGYKTISVSDAGAKAAAEFAVSAQGKKQNAKIALESIKIAESQIVQGTNFRLCMEVSIANADETVEFRQMVRAVIYRNLKQQFSLTSWKEEECAEEEE